MTPCQYATGEEVNVVKSFPNVAQVFTPRQTLAQIWSPTLLPDRVVFLGGDPMYAKRLAKKAKVPLIGYGEHQFRGFDAFFRKSPSSDLMLSDLTPMPRSQRNGVALLPGSRPEHLAVALPLMAQMIDDPSTVTVMLSPFTNQQTVSDLQARYPKLLFKQMTSPNDLASFNLAITIPGTNTMQLAVLGVPFLMIFPTHDPSILRMDGLLGLLLHLPFFGTLLKRFILRVAVSKTRQYALPNQYFKAHVCPELVGRFSLADARESFRVLGQKDDDFSNSKQIC